jgi:hypothetical protein
MGYANKLSGQRCNLKRLVILYSANSSLTIKTVEPVRQTTLTLHRSFMQQKYMYKTKSVMSSLMYNGLSIFTDCLHPATLMPPKPGQQNISYKLVI